MAKATTPLAAAWLVVPCNVPLPAARAAVTIVLLSALRRFPNWSSMRIMGCCAKAAPAVALAEDWVAMVSLLAAAGLTAITPEVEPVKVPLVN